MAYVTHVQSIPAVGKQGVLPLLQGLGAEPDSPILAVGAGEARYPLGSPRLTTNEPQGLLGGKEDRAGRGSDTAVTRRADLGQLWAPVPEAQWASR